MDNCFEVLWNGIKVFNYLYFAINLPTSWLSSRLKSLYNYLRDLIKNYIKEEDIYMEQRILGRSGIKVSPMGIGCCELEVILYGR